MKHFKCNSVFFILIWNTLGIDKFLQSKQNNNTDECQCKQTIDIYGKSQKKALIHIKNWKNNEKRGKNFEQKF